jgi:hypothetical protein
LLAGIRIEPNRAAGKTRGIEIALGQDALEFRYRPQAVGGRL